MIVFRKINTADCVLDSFHKVIPLTVYYSKTNFEFSYAKFLANINLLNYRIKNF